MKVEIRSNIVQGGVVNLGDTVFAAPHGVYFMTSKATPSSVKALLELRFQVGPIDDVFDCCSWKNDDGDCWLKVS